MIIVVATCTCQKHVTNVSNHNSMCKSDGAMPFSLGCQKVMDYPESAKTQIQEPAQQNIDELRIFVDVGKVEKYVSRTGLGEEEEV